MASSAPHGLDQRIAAQQAEAMHTRTRMIEIKRDGSDGRRDIRDEAFRLEDERPNVAAHEHSVAARQHAVSSVENDVAQIRSSMRADAARGVTDPEKQEQLEEKLAVLDRNKGELAHEQQRLAEAKELDQKYDDEIRQLGAEDTKRADQWDAAEKQLDSYEQQNQLLVQAQTKFAEADRTGDPATAVAAQALLDQADAIAVDRGAIRMEVSQFAEVAPTDLDEVERNFEPDPADDGPHGLGEDTGPDWVPDQTDADLDPNLLLDQTNPDGALPDPQPLQTDPDGSPQPSAMPAAGPDGVIDVGDIDEIPMPAGAGAAGPAGDGEPSWLDAETALTSSVAAPDGSDLSVEIGEATIDPNAAEQGAGSAAVGYIDPNTGKLYVEPQQEPGDEIEVGPAQVDPTPGYEIEVGPAQIDPAGAAGSPAPPTHEEPIAPVDTDPIQFPDTPSIDPSIPGLGDGPSFDSSDEPAYEDAFVDQPVEQTYAEPAYEETSYDDGSYGDSASTDDW